MSPQIPPPPPPPPAAFSTRLPHLPRSSGRPHTYPVSHRLLPPHPRVFHASPGPPVAPTRLRTSLGPPSVHPCHTRLPRFSHRPRAPPTILPPPPRICLVSSGPPVALTYHPGPTHLPRPVRRPYLSTTSPPVLPHFLGFPATVRGLPCLPGFPASPVSPTIFRRPHVPPPVLPRLPPPLHVFLTSSDPPVALTYHPGSSHRPHAPPPTHPPLPPVYRTSPVSPAVVTGLPHLPLFSR
ncbi:hypothetical protein K439DRAFT_1613934 [Ramaria rubella]|nr:hypothetical protein K439DRAFT_1613934 [Ramaria rubella]